jgi:hypothetical protein
LIFFLQMNTYPWATIRNLNKWSVNFLLKN